MRKSPYVTFTAEQEVEMTREFKALMTAAGWQLRERRLEPMRAPLSKLRQVASFVFSRRVMQRTIVGDFLGWEDLPLLMPLANFEYEKSFLSRLHARNERALRDHAMTWDQGVNEVLGMCL